MSSDNGQLRKLALTVLAGLAGTLPAASQEAATPAYNIELIVFRATSAEAGAENWSLAANAGTGAAGEESASGSSQVGHFISLLEIGRASCRERVEISVVAV